MSKKILITGNHHTPAIELIEQLKQDAKFKWHIYYITHSFNTENHIKNSLEPLLKTNLYQIKGGKFHRYSLLKTITDLPKTFKAIWQSYQIIKKIKPDIVVSFGGYISVPVVFSAKLLNIPSISHEQTTTLSLSSKINGLFSKKICLSFDNKLKSSYFSKKAVYTGNLIRRQIFLRNSKNYKHLTSVIKKKPLIFVSGGNQSSSIINKNFLAIKDQLVNNFTIIHHTGQLDYQFVTNQTKKNKNYYTTTYVGPQDIGWVLNNSQLIINRSGANYCQEIAILKKNSILIPLPFSQQNEQLKNALWLRQKLPKNTIIIEQKNLNPANLLKAINRLSKIELNQIKAKAQANYKVLKLVHKYV